MSSIQRSVTKIQLSDKASDIFNTKRIGVALGPGFPIGLVDLGMLIALEQLKIPISMISGTSMGAVLGALYATGTPSEEVREYAIRSFGHDHLKGLIYRDMKIPGFGLTNADRLIEELIKFLGTDPDFYELNIPLFIVAADKVSQKSVIIRHGKVFEAVRASLGMPVVITKHQIGDMKLADGAIFSSLHTEILYSEGAEIVIGIQAKPIRSNQNRILPLRSRMEPYLLKMLGWETNPEIYFTKPECDILLRPRVPQNLYKDNGHVNEIIDLGIKITYEAIQEIEDWKIPHKTSAIKKDEISSLEEISSINLKMENKASEIETYLTEYEEKTEKMTDGELMEEFPKFASIFRHFLDELSTQYPDPKEASKILKEKIKNLTDFVNKSPFMNRCLKKPQGYAGDYQMMNYLYDDNIFNAQTNMGKLLNYFLFSAPAATAVRNRAKILQGFIQYKLSQDLSLSVASIACGPAREVSTMDKFLTGKLKKAKIVWTLMDQDPDSLAYAKKNIPKHPNIEPKFVDAGIKQLLRKRISLDQQDIIYSLGLFDYLEEKVAVLLIRSLYAFLNPGGTLLIGNFHPRNPLRVLMEGGTDWFLIHRTEEEMLELGKAGAPEGRHYIMAEPGGVNLILVVTKPLNFNS
jgi:predicted acylesterase/phospholipase RssA/SAM-dependent methyltransferase